MNSSPHISVLITSYNRQEFIAESIKSVLNQSFGDFELIIVDDASNDSTYTIAASYAAIDHRIRLYRNDNNLGQFENRNKAASLAKGIYLKYVDSDDTIEEKCLEVMVNAMENYPSAVWGTVLIENNFERSNFPDIKLPCMLDRFHAYRLHFEAGGLLFTGPIGTIYLATVFRKIGGFDSSLGTNADVDLNFKMANCGNIVIAENMVNWRRHSEQISVQQDDKLKMIYEKYLIHSVNLKKRNSNDIPNKYLNKWLLIQTILYTRNLILLAIQNRNLNVFKTLISKSTIKWYQLFFCVIPIRWVNITIK